MLLKVTFVADFVLKFERKAAQPPDLEENTCAWNLSQSG